MPLSDPIFSLTLGFEWSPAPGWTRPAGRQASTSTLSKGDIRTSVTLFPRAVARLWALPRAAPGAWAFPDIGVLCVCTGEGGTVSTSSGLAASAVSLLSNHRRFPLSPSHLLLPSSFILPFLPPTHLPHPTHPSTPRSSASRRKRMIQN